MPLAPTPGRVHDAGPDANTWTFIVEGEKCVLYPDLVDGDATRAIREQTGMSFQKVLELFGVDADIDLIAILVWVARCQAGERVNFTDVASTINRKSNIDVEVSDERMPDDHPLP